MEQPEADGIATLFDDPPALGEERPRARGKVVLVVVGVIAALALVPIVALLGIPLIRIVVGLVQAGGS
jgi:hypothetical protein